VARKPRPSVSEILRFAEQLSGLCALYHPAEAWFVPRGSVRLIELYDMAHLHKSHIRSGGFAIAFNPNLPRHRLAVGASPVKPADWYVSLHYINTLSSTLEEEFLSNLLQCTFNTVPPPLW